MLSMKAGVEKHNVDFHIAEYSAIQSEIQLWIGRSSDSLTYSMIANGVIVAWLSETNKNVQNISPVTEITSFIPLVITAYALLIFLRAMRTISLLEKYSSEVEAQFAIEGLGFYSRLFAVRSRRYMSTKFVIFMLFTVQLILSIALILNRIPS
jgi:hypothetical protein